MDIRQNYRPLEPWNYWVAQKKVIDKIKTGESMPSLEVVKVALVQCNIVNNQYQQNSEVLYTFRPN